MVAEVQLPLLVPLAGVVLDRIRSKLLIILGTLITLIIVLLSLVHYVTVKRSIIVEGREKQLITVVKASQSSLRVILEKAVETSELLAEDPALVHWFQGRENDDVAKQIALQRLDGIQKRFHYHTVFAVSNHTYHYWQENFNCIDVISEDDPDDSWYFETLKRGVGTSFNFDYNRELKQTILFINVMMGDTTNVLGIAGVGIDPSMLIDEFDKLKPTDNSRLWLIDSIGNIHLSERHGEINQSIDHLLSTSITKELLSKQTEGVISGQLMDNKLVEIAFANVGTTGYKIVLLVPTEELLGVLVVIRNNTVWVTMLAFLITFIVISIISNHLTRPLYRLTRLTRQYAKGDFKQRIRSKLLSRKDEIGMLANAFDAMQQQLALVIRRLSETNAALHEEKNQLKAANTKLEDALIQVAESDRLAKAFLANISHEIRTPMNSIMGFAQLLELEEMEPSDHRYYAQQVVKSGNDLVEMINSIVNISKVEAQFIKPHKKWIEVQAVILQLVEKYQRRAEEAGLQLISQQPEEEGRKQVYTDEIMLKQALTCLLTNALKFTREGHIIVGYRWNGDIVEFFVKDTGIGIAPDKKEVIFEPFVQVNQTTMGPTGGTGLGLTLAKKLVQSLGGKIWVESNVNEGASFYFTVEKNTVS